MPEDVVIPGIKLPLHAYQAFAFIKLLLPSDSHVSAGLYADEMGLGKTSGSIAMFAFARVLCLQLLEVTADRQWPVPSSETW